MSKRKAINNPFSVLNNTSSCNTQITNEYRLNNESHYQFVFDEALKSYSSYKKKKLTRNQIFSNFLEDVDLPKTICQKNNNHYIFDSHGGISGLSIDKKHKLIIPDNVYLISFDNHALFADYSEVLYLILRMGLQNRFQNSFLEEITKTILKNDIYRLLFNHSIKKDAIHKYFKIKNFKLFQPGEEFSNFNLTSDENNMFMTGLSKLPLKPMIASKNPESNDWNISTDYKTYKQSIIYPDSLDLESFHSLINPSFDNHILIQQNEYYTFHHNYLQRIKQIPNIQQFMNNMHSFQELGVNVKTSTNSKRVKKITLSDVIQKLVQKDNPTPDNPIIIFCSFCTSSEDIFYPQNKLFNQNIPLSNNIPNFPNENENKNIKNQISKIRNQFHNANPYNQSYNYTNYTDYDWGNEPQYYLSPISSDFIQKQLIATQYIFNTFGPIYQRFVPLSKKFIIKNFNSNNIQQQLITEEELSKESEFGIKLLKYRQFIFSFLKAFMDNDFDTVILQRKNDFFQDVIPSIYQFIESHFHDFKSFLQYCNLQTHYYSSINYGDDGLYLDFFIPSLDFLVIILLYYSLSNQNEASKLNPPQLSRQSYNFDRNMKNYATKPIHDLPKNHHFNTNLNWNYYIEEGNGFMGLSNFFKFIQNRFLQANEVNSENNEASFNSSKLNVESSFKTSKSPVELYYLFFENIEPLKGGKSNKKKL